MLLLVMMTGLLNATPPELLIPYSEGHPIVVDLVRIPGNDGDGFPMYLESHAALALQEMSQEAKKVGLEIKLNYAFRRQFQQIALWRQYHRRRPTALPGHSDHQAGLSVDLQNTNDRRFRNWVHKNAKRFGFVFDVRGEAWHMTYTGSQADFTMEVSERVLGSCGEESVSFPDNS